MKQLIFIFFITSLEVFSQDTIRFRNGDLKVAKITEVGISNVKFYSFDNPEGPLYTVNKNDVKLIKYKGGNIDSLAVDAVKIVEAPAVEFKNKTLGRLTLQNKTTFYYNGITLDKSDVERLLHEYPNEATRIKLLELNKQVEKCNRIAKTSLGLGYGFGFGVTAVAGFIGGALFLLDVIVGVFTFGTAGGDGSVGGTILVTGIFVGAAIRITGAVLQKLYKNKAAHLKEQMVELYNNGLK